jgi:hypothetical protein
MTNSVPTNSSHSPEGIHCRGCDQLLPLRMSAHQEVAALWECAACNTSFAGVLLLDSIGTRAKAVRLAQIHFGAEDAEPLPAGFPQIVADAAAKQIGPLRHEQRRSPREARRLNAIAVGLDAKFMLSGESRLGIVINLSSHGMLLATPLPLQVAHAAIQMDAGIEKVQLLGRVVWSRQLGLDCHGAGIDFVARLGKVPTAGNSASGSSATEPRSGRIVPAI